MIPFTSSPARRLSSRLRRGALALSVASATAALVWPTLAAAQNGPLPPLKVMVGFAAGGGTDLVARIYADALREQLKTTVLVENKPGAGGALAAQAVAAAPASTPTLLVAIDHQVALLQHIMKNPGFDAERDLQPVGRLVTYDMCLAVNAQVPARDVAEYAAAVKADPRNGNVAVPAPGSNAQFIAHVIGTHYGLKLVPVPYRGAAPAMNDLAGGQVRAAVMPCDAFIQFAKSGTVRVVAIAGDKRSPRLPEVAALQEVGIRVPASNNFLGAYAAKTMDPKLVAALAQATREVFKQPSVVERLNATGMSAGHASAEDLARFGREAAVFWGAQVKSSGFAVE